MKFAATGPDDPTDKKNKRDVEAQEKPETPAAKQRENSPSPRDERHVTNEDEQNKITNSGSGTAMDEKEQEGV